MKNFKLGEDLLSFEIISKYLAGEIKSEVSNKKRAELEKVRKFVEDKVESNNTYYGINTGFGMLANKKIDKSELSELQINLIRSHAYGVGEPLPNNIVRLMMLLRAHVIAFGYSGASLGVLDLLKDMITHEIIPIIPSQGSVGASGDLSPLSFLALSMIGEGEVYYKGEKMSSSDALEKAGLKKAELKAKDGLTLINGTQAMTALSSYAIFRAEHLIKLSDIAASLSIEGLRGSLAPFDERVSLVRPQKGQIEAAKSIRSLLKDSENILEHKNCPRVQDPYSLRCVPQVHGAVRDAFSYVRSVIMTELNSCTDNPLVFPDDDEIISGGNFHGEALAIAMDTLGIAMAELGSISERRVEQMTNPKSGDLPVMFLSPKAGLNSGFMIPHVVTSALVSENKTLAHPASVDSISTSAGQEDHVSMGMWAANKALKIIDNVEWILVTEIIGACQAIDLHEKKLELGKGTKKAYKFVRKYIAKLETDRFLMPEVIKLHEEIMKGRLEEEVIDRR